ncbi:MULTISPECIES: ComF family protein [unclassified Leucobacter]|uniref:ComF family protein n=1 Tax=unclassified Leucobacter TaxID=2621730 RepID=UPI00165DDCC8|nr:MULTISPECIES: phosphoribosyltransferase family protein [unclassified Leucobacter]MBC9927563.1 ComF family protein [Leucobacter sp. cx-169]
MTWTFRLPRALRELAADLAALVWPVECAGCARPDRACCDACLAGLLRQAHAAAPQVAVPADAASPPADVAASPAWAPAASEPTAVEPAAAGPPVFGAGAHEGLLRDLLVPFKHAGRTSLAPILGRVLAVPLERALALAHGPDPPLVVPIPSRPERVRDRGYRHVEILGREAIRALGATGVRTPVLRRALRTLPGRTSQVGLRAGARRRNAAKIAVSSRMVSRVRTREVVLLDDVRTTGETLAAAAAVLTRDGAKIVAVVTLSQALRHAPRK